MKAKVERGGGFRGALNYVLDEGPKRTGKKNPEVVGSTVTGGDARGMTREFALTRRLRPDIARPVWHCSLALSKGERLDSAKWNEVAADFMQEMSFPPDTAYTVVRHNDTDFDHIHIVASRISMGGQVWHGKFEAVDAINATQKLERRHGLKITPGLGGADAEKDTEAKLSMDEISMAERTGVQPPKLLIVNAINAILKDGPISSSDFIRRLRDEYDVYVRPNMSGEKLNGFSFETQGIAFSGLQLAKGKALIWKNLQKKGVTYEQTRDSEEIAYAVRLAAERSTAPGLDQSSNQPDSSRIDDVEGNHQSDAAVDIQPTGEHRSRTLQSGESGRDVGLFDGGSAEHSGNNSQEGGKGYGFDYEHDDGSDRSAHKGQSSSNVGGSRNHQEFSNRDWQGERTAGSHQSVNEDNEGSSMEGITNQRSSGSGGSGSTESWNSRFKRTSVAKRAAKQPSVEKPKRSVGETQIADAKRLDPTHYLESAGFVVRKEGKHISVRTPTGDEVYRITLKQDGHYVACDRYENGIGDNIALVREIEPGTSFPDAVYRLSGGTALTDVVMPVSTKPVNEPPKLPPETPESKDEGRSYLQRRGISLSSISEAERQAMLRYAPGAVVFVGYDQNKKVRAATRRATDPEDPIQKRDFRGTDKSYPPIILGSTKDVWIVEGGADALAALDMARRQGKESPTVIVSGGSNVRSFLENPDIQAFIMGATSVTVAAEREKDTKTQEAVDASRQKQIDRLIELGAKPIVYMPPEGIKDLAEHNQAEVKRLDEERQRQAAAYMAAKNGEGEDSVGQYAPTTRQKRDRY